MLQQVIPAAGNFVRGSDLSKLRTGLSAFASVGAYTKVPEHSSVDSVRQQWFTNEFATAPEDKALIVCTHHPHSGKSKVIANSRTRRWQVTGEWQALAFGRRSPAVCW